MKPHFRYIIILFIFIFQFGNGFSQQKIGIVLSGGGATGFAHIGVLKALEENNIPIDYITGTSAGALIGAMYAAGYSPNEIERYVLSDEFQLMTNGKIKPSQRFALREDDNNASILNFNFTLNGLIKKSLPTNFISSSYLDFEMLKTLGTVSASHNKNFDSLFIPFRCVASDISSKKSITFSQGDLNQAVRASMTFPFYLSPIKIDGKLLFDGGLYNNFPANVMYHDFNPDFIIGSNVSFNAEPATEDDLLSQMINMSVSYTSFELPCEYGIIIQPKTNVTTFDFEDVKQAIVDGYNSTLPLIAELKKHIENKREIKDLENKRIKFKEETLSLTISEIETNSNKQKPILYAQHSMFNTKVGKSINADQLEKRFFRLYSSPQIDFIYPTLTQKTDSTYSLKLEIRKSKEFKFEAGGSYSSRPINTGFIGVSYRHVGKIGINIKGNSYFGKFYSSAKAEIEFDIPSTYPISVTPYFVLNRWDYFKNFATFFEAVKPSFLIQNEMYYGLKTIHPIGNNSKSTIDFRLFNLEDDYYQTNNFSSTDTTDKTYFNGSNISWEINKNTLNRKQFATEGNLLFLKIKYINGTEHSISGSTSINKYDTKLFHHWLSINGEIKTFVFKSPIFHLGIHAKGVFNTQSLFNNYTASLLAMSSFSPLPDIETYFLAEYRSPQHLGGGLNLIFTLKKKIDLRFDTYYYQPFVYLIKKQNETFGYSNVLKGVSIIASSSLIYNTFFGPIRATINYFPKQQFPINFQISYGYVIFNDRAIR